MTKDSLMELGLTQEQADKVMESLDAALRDAGAINAVTVKPLLVSFLEKAALTENGEIPGLADEISKLAKDESTSFLFRGKETGVPVVSGASPAGSVTAAPQTLSTGYEIRLEQARKAGNSALAVAIKREAAADGIQLY